MTTLNDRNLLLEAARGAVEDGSYSGSAWARVLLAQHESLDSEVSAAMDVLGCEIRRIPGAGSTCDVHGGRASDDGVCQVVRGSIRAARQSRGQEPTDAEVLAALNVDYGIRHPLTSPSDTLNAYGDWEADIMRAAIRAARDVRWQA